MIEIFVDRVRILCAHQEVAVHPRCYTAGQFILDPRHYLKLLERKPGSLDTTFILDAGIDYLASAPRPLEYRTRVRFHHHTSEILARVIPLSDESIAPGGSGKVQLRLESPAVVVAGDLQTDTGENRLSPGLADQHAVTVGVVLLGELLHQAEKLLVEGVHPLTIIEGYREAYRETLRVYKSLSQRMDSWDEAFLRNVAYTSLSGRITEREGERISELILEAVEMPKLYDERGAAAPTPWRTQNLASNC